jgi:hypothetical protein
MRRKPNSRPRAQSKPGIRRRLNVAGAIGQARVPHRRLRKSDRARPIRPRAIGRANPGVVDDLPHIMPVSRRELDVIETYLRGFLDDALGRPQ